MRPLIVLASFLLAASAANAQVTNVTGQSGNILTSPNGQTQFEGSGVLNGMGGSGGSFQSIVESTPDYVSFESGNASSGPFFTSVSTSSVDITFTNNAGASLIPQLESTIIPAGFGLYIADRSGGCGGNFYTGCPQSTSGLTFADLPANAAIPPGQPVASASFDFSVTSEGQTLYTLSAALNLIQNPQTLQYEIVEEVAALQLAFGSNLHFATPGSELAFGYAWDETNFTVDFLTALAPGASRTLTYQTTVTSFSRVNCVDPQTCLVAYSGFGDPVGRGGGISRMFGASSAGGIDDVVFQPAVFQRPVYENGKLTFVMTPTAAVVPEPATWALMLTGFGLAGLSIRQGHRRRAA